MVHYIGLLLSLFKGNNYTKKSGQKRKNAVGFIGKDHLLCWHSIIMCMCPVSLTELRFCVFEDGNDYILAFLW